MAPWAHTEGSEGGRDGAYFGVSSVGTTLTGTVKVVYELLRLVSA